MSEIKVGYQTTERPEHSANESNANEFLIRQILSRTNTCTLVKVLKVTNAGGLEPVGFVDILPLVHQLDGYGNAVPHGTIYHIPYVRIQGGTDAIILDPKVGDIGIALFAQHDISSVKANKGPANPGSFRRFDHSDGLYLGGVLNGTPEQYVRFSEEGIHIVSPHAVTIEAPSVTVNADEVTVTAPDVTINADNGVTIDSPTVTCSGDVIASGVSLVHHTHGGVESGPSSTGEPN